MTTIIQNQKFVNTIESLLRRSPMGYKIMNWSEVPSTFDPRLTEISRFLPTFDIDETLSDERRHSGLGIYTGPDGNPTNGPDDPGLDRYPDYHTLTQDGRRYLVHRCGNSYPRYILELRG